MSTRLPLRVPRPLYRQCVFQRTALRPFSSSTPRPRQQKRIDPMQTEAAAEQQGGRAPAAVYEESLADKRNLVDDLGLFPGTIILPSLNKIPNLLSRDALRFGWKYLKSRVKGWASLWQYRQAKSTKPKPKVNWFPWSKGQLKSIALARHEQIYTAFANGDHTTISKICLSGVTKQFCDRITARPSGMKMRWTVSPSKKARVVSNRGNALDIPGHPETALRQIVVRIDTIQTLEIDTGPTHTSQGLNRRTNLAWTPNGRQPPQKQNPFDTLPQTDKRSERVIEYLVLQKRLYQGVEEDWKVWGFANESTLETITEDEEFERDISAYQTKQMA